MKERVFIQNARLSFPALAEPRETMAGNGDLKYQATFLLDPDNPSVKRLQEAIIKIARSEYKEKADSVLKNRDKVPLKKGNDKETVSPGYENKLYISAKSKKQPELRDANPRVVITDPKVIMDKFVPGYRVNGYVELYSYSVKGPTGATIKSGIAAGLLSVQFAAYDDAFGTPLPSADDYPDCSDQVEKSQGYETDSFEEENYSFM